MVPAVSRPSIVGPVWVWGHLPLTGVPGLQMSAAGVVVVHWLFSSGTPSGQVWVRVAGSVVTHFLFSSGVPVVQV